MPPPLRPAKYHRRGSPVRRGRLRASGIPIQCLSPQSHGSRERTPGPQDTIRPRQRVVSAKPDIRLRPWRVPPPDQACCWWGHARARPSFQGTALGPSVLFRVLHPSSPLAWLLLYSEHHGLPERSLRTPYPLLALNGIHSLQAGPFPPPFPPLAIVDAVRITPGI